MIQTPNLTDQMMSNLFWLTSEQMGRFRRSPLRARPASAARQSSGPAWPMSLPVKLQLERPLADDPLERSDPYLVAGSGQRV